MVLLFLIVLFVVSLGYPPRVKLLPWVFMFPAAALAVMQILKDTVGRGKGGKKAESALGLGEWVARLGGTDRGYLAAMLWILGLLLLLYLLGFAVAVPVFIFFYLKLHGESWRLSVGLSIAFGGILYAAFIYALKVSLYEGVLFLSIFQ